jgi:hypothetical protein
MLIPRAVPCVLLSLLLFTATASSLQLVYAERHSPVLRQYSGLAVNGIAVLRAWLSQLNLTAPHDEVDSKAVQRVLELVYSRGDLALFIGSIQLRVLKLYSGRGFLLTEEDVASTLLAVAKSVGVNLSDVGCDKAISKLLVNMYYGYELCPYNVTDIDEFMDYAMYLGRNASPSAVTPIVSKLLILKLLYLGEVSIDASTFSQLYDELLYNKSLVTALFIKSLTAYHAPKLVNKGATVAEIPVIEFLKGVGNTSADVKTFEKLVYSALLILEKYSVKDVKLSDILTAVFVALSSNPADLLSIVNRSASIIGMDYNEGAFTGSSDWAMYYEGGAPYMAQFIQSTISSLSKNASCSHIPTGTAEFMEAVGEGEQSNVCYTQPSANRLRQRIAISADAFGRRVKAVEDVVARANVVVLAELASNTSTEPQALQHSITVVREGPGADQVLLLMLLFAPLAIVALPLRGRLLTILSYTPLRRLLARSSSEVMSSRHLPLDKRYLVLQRFWDLVVELARRVGIRIEACNTHREVLGMFKNSGKASSSVVRLVERAALAYEVVRYSSEWGGDELELLSNLLKDIERGCLGNVK